MTIPKTIPILRSAMTLSFCSMSQTATQTETQMRETCRAFTQKRSRGS